MLQKLLMPLKCKHCGQKYYEQGYWGDGRYCLKCSGDMRREELKEKEELAEKAKKFARSSGLDLDQYANELPEEVRRLLNPKNAGRKPVKYRPEFCELLVEMASEGKSEAEFAAAVGISQPLITHWTETRPRFKQAREIAGEVYRAWLENFYRNAMTNNVPCQPSLLLRLTKVKLGWTDRDEGAGKGPSGEIPVVVNAYHDKNFPSETVQPTPEQMAEAGLEKAAV